MDLALIERLMRMLEQSDLEMLDVEEGGMRIRLAKAGAIATSDAVGKSASGIIDAANEPTNQAELVTAGIAGTFYVAPAPGAAPFVVLGDRVIEGQQLGIIEAMKLLNPVEADRDGLITAVHVTDGQSVVPGTPLFLIGDT